MILFKHFNFLIPILLTVNCVWSVQDITEQVFGSATGFQGQLAAFSDINNDKHTDIFILSESQLEITILSEESDNAVGYSTNQVVSLNSSQAKVSGLIPADCNGDGFVDLLLSMKTQDNDFSMQAILGSEGGKFTEVVPISDIALRDEPLLLDANSDMIPDLFVVLANNTRQFWVNQPDTERWRFIVENFTVATDNVPLSQPTLPHSHAFVDLTGDGSADLFFTGLDGDNNLVFEVWEGTKHGLVLNKFYKLNGKGLEVGQSVFADINQDGMIDHLIPVCEVSGNRCSKSRILMFDGEDFVEIFQATNDWNFIPSSVSGRPITLVTGGYDQDIFVDVLAVMANTNGSMKAKSVVLFGGVCSLPSCSKLGTEFRFGFSIPDTEDSFSAAFFDIQNDGSLDILVSLQVGGKMCVRAYKNTAIHDASFLMVKVLPGLTREGGSSNIPGATVSYTTTNTLGGSQRGTASQLPQTAHLSLSLPYVLFGLGRLPNYVDSLQIFIPTPLIPTQNTLEIVNDTYSPLSKTWTMVIPNSQLYVIPNPVSVPSSWISRLYVTPSHNLLSTLFVLLSTLIVISVAIILLHCVERYEDKKEKTQEAHRFHFDAM